MRIAKSFEKLRRGPWTRRVAGLKRPGYGRRFFTGPNGVSPQVIGIRFRTVDVATCVNGHAFGRHHGFVLRPRNRDEHRDLAVSGAPDPDALLEARILLLVRLRVGDKDRVVGVDENAARAAKLFPLFKEFPVLVEI